MIVLSRLNRVRVGAIFSRLIIYLVANFDWSFSIINESPLTEIEFKLTDQNYVTKTNQNYVDLFFLKKR